MEEYLRVSDPESKYLINVENYDQKVLDPKIVVHHKNHIKHDNRVSNLECMSKTKHQVIHNKENEKFRKRDNKGRYISYEQE